MAEYSPEVLSWYWDEPPARNVEQCQGLEWIACKSLPLPLPCVSIRTIYVIVEQDDYGRFHTID